MQRAIRSSLVMAILLFGLAVMLVPIGTGAAAAVKTSISTRGLDHFEDEPYAPYQGERFDDFDWRLCKKLSKRYSGNMLISPISIKLALVLLYEGAQGQTAHELADALQLPDRPSAVRDRFVSVLRSLQATNPDYTFDISTRLFVDTSIEPTQRYSSVVKTFYSTDVSVLNLTDARVSLKIINDWVSNVTHGHVKEVLTDEEKIKESIFVVLNALYFMGTWRHPFTPNLTRVERFFTGIDESVSVPFMHTSGRYRYIDAIDLDAQILRLPYLGQKYAMFIVLPRARTGIRQLTEDVNPYVLRRLIQQMEEVPVDVSIPKFKFEFTTHLEDVLRELGIRDIFDNTASFLYIARAKRLGQRLSVSDFVQKAGLEVDEVGTTAHAVTEVQIGNKMGDTVFSVRHSFLFFIEDETTGTVIFVGKVTDPSKIHGTFEESVAAPTRMGEQNSFNPVPAAGLAPGKIKG